MLYSGAVALGSDNGEYNFFDRGPIRRWEVWALDGMGRALLDVMTSAEAARELIARCKESDDSKQYEIIERKDPLTGF